MAGKLHLEKSSFKACSPFFQNPY